MSRCAEGRHTEYIVEVERQFLLHGHHKKLVRVAGDKRVSVEDEEHNKEGWRKIGGRRDMVYRVRVALPDVFVLSSSCPMMCPCLVSKSARETLSWPTTKCDCQ